MAKSIKALYEDGVFKPLSKVRLKNKQKVRLTVTESEKSPIQTTKPAHNHRSAARGKKNTLHPGYRIVGVFKSGLHDLSKNHDAYLYP
jgi:predicted DNA-binding antitoxin AbrB/MazE fold protein